MSRTRAHVIISGFVQGVFFRANTIVTAHQFGVTGWVKNRYDGKVEAVFEGEKQAVEKTVEWCRRGPEGALVQNVDVQWQEYKGEFDSFELKR